MAVGMSGLVYSRLLDGLGLAETGIQSWYSNQMEFPQWEWM
jgi:hypothetical protein